MANAGLGAAQRAQPEPGQLVTTLLGKGTWFPLSVTIISEARGSTQAPQFGKEDRPSTCPPGFQNDEYGEVFPEAGGVDLPYCPSSVGVAGF